jgi:hypothetical protein
MREDEGPEFVEGKEKEREGKKGKGRFESVEGKKKEKDIEDRRKAGALSS